MQPCAAGPAAPATTVADAALVARFGPRVSRALRAFRSDTSYATQTAVTGRYFLDARGAGTSDDGTAATA